MAKVNGDKQIVIPAELHDTIDEGEDFVVLRDGNKIELKRFKELDEKTKDDLEFTRRTEEALQRYERGEFISMEGEKFLEEIKKW